MVAVENMKKHGEKKILILKKIKKIYILRILLRERNLKESARIHLMVRMNIQHKIIIRVQFIRKI